MWVVEVCELTGGQGGRSECGGKEVLVSVNFRRYRDSVRTPLSKGGEDGRKRDSRACAGDEKVDASGGRWGMSGPALVRAWSWE